MKFTRNGILALASMVAVASGCASPPKVPAVPESDRRPVNSQATLDLQRCRGDLTNARLMLDETTKLADSVSVALSQMTRKCADPGAPAKSSASMLEGGGGQCAASARPVSLVASRDSAAAVPASAPSSSVFILLFPYGSTAVNLLDKSAIALSDATKDAALIVVRGRADGTGSEPANNQVARARAEAVQAYLVATGVPASRIRVTFQGVGDYVADNASESGRSQNRRVEVEVYPHTPDRVLLSMSTK